ncbi:VOC family protein [Gorillibacterium sp. sgz5001074]|uniref:VOC family protein n=1 Tax=Gorillibacterium sp. sgz5001074 TaxID=3446695 RepID=UPI003F67E5E8
MSKELWINLPVKDMARSKAFYKGIGFLIHPRHGEDAHMAALVVGEPAVNVMLFPEDTFRGFTGSPVADARQGAEVLISIGAQSRAEVDELISRVVPAGGTVYGAPAENQGWMYGAGFADPDGHRWNVLFMDDRKAP